MDKSRSGEELKIAVIGGGTGSFTILSALKYRTTAITALVSMADDGGSTGVLRDEMGALPAGDIRQCLVALSDAPRMRDLFNFRFDEGTLKGHAFGNLFLAALEKMTGNFASGIELASEVLNITGTVEPITLTNVRLAMREHDGNETRGESAISHLKFNYARPDMWLEPKAEANPRAIEAISHADIVIVAPGSLYNSLAPALIVPGIGRALKRSKALKIYVCNLVTKPGQTDGYDVCDFADEIERLVGVKFLDVVLFNNEMPSSKLLKKYATEGELAVGYDNIKLLGAHYEATGAPLLSGKVLFRKDDKADQISASRTLIRHDSAAVADAIFEIYNQFSRHTKS